MSWSFYIRTTLLICLIAVPASFSSAATSTTIGEKNCDTIDANWENYNQNILGANTKVSDVVLNACKAMGIKCQATSGCRYNPGDANESRSQCTENHGADGSQHRFNNAIDLVVPEGREVEFITLAICGLRKVNNCEGGIGYYRNKSIHVDVREGHSSVWSTGYHRTDIVDNVNDATARSLLYGFGDGGCVAGSITTDSTDKEIYGEPERYTPPEGYSQDFMLVVQPEDSLINRIQATTQSSLYNSLYGFFQPFGAAFSGGQSTTDGSILSGNTTQVSSSETLDYSTPNAGNTGILNNTNTNTTSNNDGGVLEYSPDSFGQATTKVVCEGSGLFGTNLFKTCTTEVVASNGQSNGSILGGLGGSQTNTMYGGSKDSSGVYASNGGTPGTVVGKAIAVFYDTYNPATQPNFSSGSQGGSGQDNYGQFTVGEAVPIQQGGTDIVRTSVKLTEQSVGYGAYYGLIHGVSPMMIGSAPRTLFRIGQQAIGSRVYNPFSI